MSRPLHEEMDPAMAQRLADRKSIIEAQVRAKRAGNTETTSHYKEEQETGGKGEEQVKASRRRLNALKAEANDSVTRYRVMTDAEENERRIKEEALQQELSEKVEEKKRSSERQQGAIQMAFDPLFKCKVAHDLLRELELQKDACNKVVNAKDDLITEFRGQLRGKEDEYVRALKTQAHDIDQLILTMHTQTETLMKAYSDELNSITKAYEEERKELLDKNNHEIDKLVEERARRERDFSKKRDGRVWEDQKILENKYEENAEKYNKVKMDYQHNIHGLAQELRRMQALYYLNQERLNYNLQVLRERVHENDNAIKAHRKKLARLRDVHSNLVARHAETERRFHQVNKDLTESYHRVTAQYKDLQLKFQHFEKADAEKFQQVWSMHENDCMKQVHKCLQVDRVIFEEELGVPWVPPSLDFWLAQNQQEQTEKKEEAEESKEDEEPLDEAAQTMLEVLYQQAPFLVEERAQEVIANLEGSDEHVENVERILYSLGVKKSAEVKKMLEYFVTDSKDGGAALINPQEAVRALHRFLEDRRKDQAASTEHADPEETDTQANMVKLQGDRRKAEKEFWGRMGRVIPDNHLRIWRAAEKGLEQYHKQLQQRANLIENTDSIRKQNDELRALLNQYLGSRLNEELFSPPQLQVAQSQ